MGHIINGEGLNVKLVYKLAKGEEEIEISKDSFEKIRLSREFLDSLLSKGQKIYGVNTSVGALMDKPRSEQSEIEMIKEHAISDGEYEEDSIARATLLILINQLASGRGTISPELFEYLVRFFNSKAIPLFSKEGSLGASGDLIPMANLAISILGYGKVKIDGEVKESEEIAKALERPELKLGDAIALINNTAYSCASLAISIVELMRALDLSLAIASFGIEIFRAKKEPFELSLLKAKKHVEQVLIGEYVLKMIEGSKLINEDERLQDSYSIRCIPQVYAAFYQALRFAEFIVNSEINSFSGNPVVISEESRIINGGNFHAESLALCADMLKICISSLAFMIERRINRTLNPNLSKGLPPFLSSNEGAGLMMLQYLAAYYLNELKILSTPSSNISLSTSADQEDFVSMSGNAVSNLRKAIKLFKKLLVIELLTYYTAAKFINYDEKAGKIRIIYDFLKKRIKEGLDLKEKLKKMEELLEEITELIRTEFGSIFYD